MDKSQLWEEGKYEAVPESAMYDESKTGNGQIIVTFAIGEHKKKVYLSLTDAAWPYTEPKLVKLGFNGNFADPGIDTNQPIMLNCKHDNYGGKWREKWDFYGEERQPAQIARDKAAALAARFKSGAAQQASKPAGRPTPPPQPGGSRPGAVTSGAGGVAPRPGSTAPRPTTQQPPAEKPKQVAKNADEAWAYWCNLVPENVREKMWTETLAKFGKPEDQMTPEEWNKMALASEIPF